MEENISNYKKQVEKLETKCSQSSEEILKGNSNMDKLQSELVIQKQKVKDKNNLIREQEQEINKHQDNIDRLNRELNEGTDIFMIFLTFI